MVAATAVVVLWIVGCGEEAPTYDPAVNYSTESLAKELSFQYRSLKSQVRAPDPSEKAGPKERTGIAVKAVKVATKEAPVGTLESLVADIARKASSFPALSQIEAGNKGAEQVEKDPSIAEADRKLIAAKLRSVTP